MEYLRNNLRHSSTLAGYFFLNFLYSLWVKILTKPFSNKNLTS